MEVNGGGGCVMFLCLVGAAGLRSGNEIGGDGGDGMVMIGFLFCSLKMEKWVISVKNMGHRCLPSRTGWLDGMIWRKNEKNVHCCLCGNGVLVARVASITCDL